MANVFSPNGFTPIRRVDGAAWTGNQTERKIAAANTHKFYVGDPVINLNTGYIDVNTTTPSDGVAGIFIGCHYLSSSQGKVVWSNQFPGGDTTTDVTAYVIDDPNVVFRVWVGTGSSSAAGGPGVLADLYKNIDYQYGTANTLSGISGAYVNFADVGLTNTLPFTIIGLVQSPPGVNGTDITTAGNIVEVVMNNQSYKAGVTGPT